MFLFGNGMFMLGNDMFLFRSNKYNSFLFGNDMPFIGNNMFMIGNEMFLVGMTFQFWLYCTIDVIKTISRVGPRGGSVHMYNCV